DRLADAEGIAADLAKAVALIETLRAKIVDIDAENDLLRAVTAGMLERPVHQFLGDALALPRAEHIELIELDRVGPPFAGKGDRTHLDEADDLAVVEREPDREIRVGQLRRQAVGAERLVEERGEIGLAIQRAEG